MVFHNNVIAGAAGAGAGAAGSAAYSIERSVRINDVDNAYLNFTPGSSSNMKTFTWSFWLKRSTLGTNFNTIYSTNGTYGIYFYFRTDNTLDFGDYYGGSYQYRLITNRTFRDVSAWYHIVIAVDTTQSTASDRLKMYVNGVQETSFSTATYPSQNFEGSVNRASIVNEIGRLDTAGNFDGYLTEFHSVDGTALAASDFGQYDSDNNWNPKDCQSSLTYGTNGFYLKFADNSSAAALGTDSSGNSNTWTVNNIDHVESTSIGLPSGYTADSSTYSGTLSNVETDDTNAITAASSHIDFDLGASYTVGTVTMKFLSYNGTCCANYRVELHGNSSYTNLVANSATVSASSSVQTITHDFGSTSARYLRISYQGGGRTAAVRFLSTTGATQTLPNAGCDSLIDTPTNYTAGSGNNGGNYCTLNPLDRTSTNGALSNGNLDITQTAASWAMYRSTMFLSSGKYYWEVEIGNNQYTTIGICASSYFMAESSNAWANADTDMYGYYPYDGNVYNGGNTISYATADTSASGSVVGVAFDMDNGTLTFYKDGTSLGQAASGLTGKSWSPTHWLYNQTNADSYNFGQRPFAFPPGTSGGPSSDYKSLCTTNLPDPTIADGSTAMDVLTWTGNAATRTLSGLSLTNTVGLAWVKNRTNALNHAMQDVVRGFTTGKKIAPNTTDSEGSSGALADSYGYISGASSTGFTIDKSGSGQDWVQMNNTSNNYVSWVWDAGSSNTSVSVGSLNSSVYDQSRTWSGDLSATSLANADKMFDWTYGYGSYTGTCTWTTTNAAYSNLSGRVYLANNTTLTLGITFKDSSNNTLGSFNLPWTGDGTQMQDTGFDWTSSVASVEIGGGYLPVRVRIGSKTLVDTGVTGLPNVPSIASTVRANPSAGFSIVSYTGNSTVGATVGHGLNDVPGLVIIKNRTTGSLPWVIKMTGMTGAQRLQFDTGAVYSESAGSGSVWNATNPSSSAITLGDLNYSNASSNDYIGYCWTPVSGFSAFGSYISGGSNDDAFVFTGMRPKLIIIKALSSAGDMSYASWLMVDSERNTYNVSDAGLFANLTAAEGTRGNGSGSAGTWLDILSNGFKIRYNGTEVNGVSGQTYVYAAFAEHPFKAARAR